MGKSADSLSGFVYPSGGGNDIGVYKQPMQDPNSADITKRGKQMDEMRPSIGGVFKSQPDTKTDGMKIRGTGAATKGTKSRGPMA